MISYKSISWQMLADLGSPESFVQIYAFRYNWHIFCHVECNEKISKDKENRSPNLHIQYILATRLIKLCKMIMQQRRNTLGCGKLCMNIKFQFITFDVFFEILISVFYLRREC